jgi:Mitochondrial carrier protein
MPQELEDPEDLTVSDTDVGRYKVLEVAVAVTGADVGATTSPATLADSSKGGGGLQHGLPLGLSSEAAVVATFQDQMHRLPKEIRNIIAGGAAGMLAKSVVAPLDRIKILYQVTSAEFKIRNIPTVVRNIVANEGYAALWKGNIATLLRVFPYAGVQFMVFDWIKMWQLRKHEMHDEKQQQQPPPGRTEDSPANQHSRKFGLTAMESLEAGMVAGTVSVVCTYPLDLARAQLAVLRRHKHPHHGGHSQQQTPSKTKGLVRVILDNYRRAGLAGLFRGMPVTLFGILPYSGIAFALNEQGKREVRALRALFSVFLEFSLTLDIAFAFAATVDPARDGPRRDDAGTARMRRRGGAVRPNPHVPHRSDATEDANAGFGGERHGVWQRGSDLRHERRLRSCCRSRGDGPTASQPRPDDPEPVRGAGGPGFLQGGERELGEGPHRLWHKLHHV